MGSTRTWRVKPSQFFTPIQKECGRPLKAPAKTVETSCLERLKGEIQATCRWLILRESDALVRRHAKNLKHKPEGKL
jgi:hypothetical protein